LRIVVALLDWRPQRIIPLEVSAEMGPPMRLHIDRNHVGGA
jgi:hypothetical protein